MNIKNAEWKDGIYKADQESSIEVYPLWPDKMKNALTDGNEYTGNVYVSFDGLCYDEIVSKVYINGNEIITPQGSEGNLGGVENREIGVNTVQTQINTRDKGYVFFSIPYSKDWRAFYNGKEVEVVKADYGFMAVEVKSGNGEIDEYSRWFYISCPVIWKSLLCIPNHNFC